MFRIFVVTIFVLSILVPFGVIADEFKYATAMQYNSDFSNIYQIDGGSMEHRGFKNGDLVKIAPKLNVIVGDVVAFACYHEKCEGMYIKEIIGKTNECYWLEGRNDVWEENNTKKQSMDSRTTYGWLCGKNIDIKGIAFAI